MFTAEEIKSLFQVEGISIYETYFSFDKDLDVALKTENIQEFVQLVKENNIKSVFYAFKYANRDDFLIMDDDIPDIYSYPHAHRYSHLLDLIFDEFQSCFKAKQDAFNKKITTDFSKHPTLLSIYCLLNGVQVGFLQEDLWEFELPDKYLVIAELEEILEEIFETTVQQEQTKNASKRDEVMERIFEYINSSDDWHSCTNQRLRRNYCYRLAEQYGKEYDVQLDAYQIIDALEVKWNQYKANKTK